MMIMIAANLMWARAAEKPEQSKLTFKNLRRIMVRDGICGESANGLKNGCRRWSVWVWVGQAGRSEKAFQTDSMLFLVPY